LFLLSPDVAADIGIHLGDGNMRIRKGGPHGSYEYSVTLNASEDQLYLVGTVLPTVYHAYDLDHQGFRINREQTWVSVRFQSKQVAIFKHEVLGLPSGRKTNLTIPEVIRQDVVLMKHLVREIFGD
jgi:hypothetical protein